MTVRTGSLSPSVLPQLAGLRVLVLNWRDIRHPQAGGAEQYMHQIARRWVAAGAQVTWFTARAAGQEPTEVIDGIRVLRSGRDALGSTPARPRAWCAAAADVDVVVDCQNGIPFFSPLFAGADVPIVQVVHHVHQDQFDLPTSRRPMRRGGPVPGGHGDASGVRTRGRSRRSRRPPGRSCGTGCSFRCPIHLVPNGSVAVPDLSRAT